MGTVKLDLPPPSFDDPEFIEDPYPVLEAAQETGLHHDEIGGVWWATRYADVNAVLHSGCGKDPARANDGPYTRAVTHMRGTLMFLDPPDHTRLRGLVSGAFPPRAIEALRPRITQLANELLAPLARSGGFDVMASFARPLSATVIAEVIGVDPADRRHFLRWSDDLAHSFNPLRDTVVRGRVVDALEAFREYFRRIVSHRRASPRNDLISRLITAHDRDDRLSDDEVVQLLVEIVDAGALTTSDLIGNGILALLTHPSELSKLRADPSLIGNAVEEILRFDASIIYTERVAVAGTTIAAAPIPVGEWILPAVAAANRDARVFANPDQFDITRANAHHQLAFGAGRHFCLGAALARVEGQVAILELLRQFPRLRLDGLPDRGAIQGFRRLDTLPVVI